MSGAIEGQDAVDYVNHLSAHQVEKDVRFLREFGRFPATSSILDIGFGSGKLLEFLCAETGYFRQLHGIEASEHLFSRASERFRDLKLNIELFRGDFLAFAFPEGFSSNQSVMSFYLHHQSDPISHINHCAKHLDDGAKLFVYDRILDNESCRREFNDFWYQEYRSAHEWHEDLPNCPSHEQLLSWANSNGLQLANYKVAQHDYRPGAHHFRKKAYELWKINHDSTITACMLIHPMFMSREKEILASAAPQESIIESTIPIPYSGDLIQKIYRGLPWVDLLAEWTDEQFKNDCGHLVVLSHPTLPRWALLSQMSLRKRASRKSLGRCLGPIDNERSIRSLFHAYHVPEPWESRTFLDAIREFG